MKYLYVSQMKVKLKESLNKLNTSFFNTLALQFFDGGMTELKQGKAVLSFVPNTFSCTRLFVYVSHYLKDINKCMHRFIMALEGSP